MSSVGSWHKVRSVEDMVRFLQVTAQKYHTVRTATRAHPIKTKVICKIIRLAIFQTTAPSINIQSILCILRFAARVLEAHTVTVHASSLCAAQRMSELQNMLH